MARTAPLTLEYTNQPAGSRVTLVETGDALIVTVPPHGTWAELRGLLLFLLPGAVSLAPMFYFAWQFSRTFNIPPPVPWAKLLGQILFVVLFDLVLAWFIGGVSTTVTLTPDSLMLEVQGRVRRRVRTFPRGSVASVRTRWWAKWVELRNDSRRLVCSFAVPIRSDRRWVADTLRATLGLDS